jgi:flagellar basal body P-ring protein FlgI
MEFLSNEWLQEWTSTHCKGQLEIEKEKAEAKAEAEKILNELENVEITTEPLTFHAKDFVGSEIFAIVMSEVAKMYSSTDDVVVRYSKPENKETREVMTCFQVLKSKAKVFQKFMEENKEEIIFSVSKNSDIKSSVKFLNSIGVKNEDGENIVSKENDLAEELKTAISPNETKALITVYYNDASNIPSVKWEVIDKDNNEYCGYSEIKELFDKIFKNF